MQYQLTAKQFVIKLYPNAYCQQVGINKTAYCQIVVDFFVIGLAKTENDAWASARENIVTSNKASFS